MCDPPQWQIAPQKYKKISVFKTNMQLIFPLFSILHTKAKMRKGTASYMASIALKLVSVNVRQMFSLMGL